MSRPAFDDRVDRDFDRIVPGGLFLDLTKNGISCAPCITDLNKQSCGRSFEAYRGAVRSIGNLCRGKDRYFLARDFGPVSFFVSASHTKKTRSARSTVKKKSPRVGEGESAVWMCFVG